MARGEHRGNSVWRAGDERSPKAPNPVFTQLSITKKTDIIQNGSWSSSISQWHYHFYSREVSASFNDQYPVNGAQRGSSLSRSELLVLVYI
jgi:hypothetical protein